MLHGRRDVRQHVNVDASFVHLPQPHLSEVGQTLEDARQNAPQETRAWITTANSGISTLIAIVAVLLSLLLGLLPHLSFH